MAGFTDIAGHWAESDIEYLKEAGIIGGYPDGTFKPNSPITRAEVAAIVARMMKMK